MNKYSVSQVRYAVDQPTMRRQAEFQSMPTTTSANLRKPIVVAPAAYWTLVPESWRSECFTAEFLRSASMIYYASRFFMSCSLLSIQQATTTAYMIPPVGPLQMRLNAAKDRQELARPAWTSLQDLADMISQGSRWRLLHTQSFWPEPAAPPAVTSAGRPRLDCSTRGSRTSTSREHATAGGLTYITSG